MDFKLTEEQELLIESVDEWVDRNITEPDIQKWYAEHGVSDEVAKSFYDAGFGMLGLPEEVGGTPADVLTRVLFTEELTRKTSAIMPFLANILTMYDVAELGTPEQIDLAMKIYADTGKSCIALAISEPEAGSDNANMSTTTTEKDGKFYLNGTKTFVTEGQVAPYMLVVAKDEDPSRENKNMSMWLIPSDSPGISKSGFAKIGQTIQSFCEVYFDNVEMDETNLFGKRHVGFMELMANFEVERLLLAASSLGLAQAALEDAAKFANQRVTFGKPICKYQLIQEKLTDMEIKCQNIRNMLYKCAWEIDNGISVRLDSALLKRYSSIAAHEVCSDAMQIFGGIGYTSETRVSRAFIDSRGNQFAGGTTEIMVHIAGRQVVKKYLDK
ncbi:MAG: acyl-CoA dehydrogenase family protein [Coriobacteriales bacterium]|jgi:alkylation response protein AidB-like acyl-CoA dehydrogenase|nr:acyl-CoA dehydrogenase family protein [Coriobacteriales bacterium]